MPAVLGAVVLPVFGIVLLSYAIARLLPLPVWLTSGIQRLTFDVAVPVLLFHTMATVDLSHPIGATLFVGYYTPTLALYALIYFATRQLGRGKALANVLALGSTYSNAVLLGIPLTLRAFGDSAAVPLFGLVAIHSATLFFLTTLLNETATGTVHLRTLLADTGRRLIANPILLGLLGGLAANALARAVGAPLPPGLLMLTGAVRAVAPTAALVAMGLGLARYALRGALADAGLISATKLLVHPALVAAAVLLLPMPVLSAKVAILVAALPSGVNVYLFAARFGHGEAASAGAILFTTLLSLATLSGVLWLLGNL